MTGTILPPTETAIARGVAKSAAVFFAMILIERYNAGRATSEYELAALLRMDTRTVHRQMTGLSAIGLVTSQADRWMLTPAGRGTLFAENTQPTYLSIEEPQELVSVEEIPAQFVHLDRLEDRLIKLNIDSSSSESDCTNCARVQQMLQSAAILFEAEISAHEAILRREPDYVLGWIAKAYADASRPGSTLRSPASLIYRRLMALDELPVMYQKNPTRGLPASFLREIGLVAEDDKAEAEQETEDDPKPVRYGDGAFSEFFNQRGDDKHKPLVRNENWRTILQDERFPEIKGIAFSAVEVVTENNSHMTVYSSRYTLEKHNQEFLQITQTQIVPIASQIYAELIGDPSATVTFELEVG